MSSAGAGGGASALDQSEAAGRGFGARPGLPADTPDDGLSGCSGGSGAWPGALLLHVRRSCATATRSVASPPAAAVICSGVMPHVIGRSAGAAQLIGERALLAERSEGDAHVPDDEVTFTSGTAGMVSEHRTSRGQERECDGGRTSWPGARAPVARWTLPERAPRRGQGPPSLVVPTVRVVERSPRVRCVSHSSSTHQLVTACGVSSTRE